MPEELIISVKMKITFSLTSPSGNKSNILLQQSSLELNQNNL